MSMLPGFEDGEGGDVDVQAAANNSADATMTGFINPPPKANYYRSLAEVENKRRNKKASRRGRPSSLN